MERLLQHMELPRENRYTVYTKSNCSYCRKVKTILDPAETMYINCDAYIRDDREEFLRVMDTLTDRVHRTFPFVFHGHKFIGGCDDLELHVAFGGVGF